MKVFWIAWLLLGLVMEVSAILYMWWKKRGAATLTQTVEPWIRSNWGTRLLWWVGATLVAIHLGTGWF